MDPMMIGSIFLALVHRHSSRLSPSVLSPFVYVICPIGVVTKLSLATEFVTNFPRLPRSQQYQKLLDVSAQR